MDIAFETGRLLLRLFTEDDASILYELNLDPEVTRYTHDPMTNLLMLKKFLMKSFYLNTPYIIMIAGPCI